MVPVFPAKGTFKDLNFFAVPLFTAPRKIDVIWYAVSSLITCSLLFFIWTVTLNYNNLIRAEINAATNCVSKVKWIEKILESAWALFVAIGWFFINRITAKVDALEKDKADGSTVGRQAGLIHEVDRRIDELQHTTVPRQEYKTDIASLHIRANELERSKEDKVTDVRIVNKDDPSPAKKGK